MTNKTEMPDELWAIKSTTAHRADTNEEVQIGYHGTGTWVDQDDGGTGYTRNDLCKANPHSTLHKDISDKPPLNKQDVQEAYLVATIAQTAKDKDGFVLIRKDVLPTIKAALKAYGGE